MLLTWSIEQAVFSDEVAGLLPLHQPAGQELQLNGVLGVGLYQPRGLRDRHLIHASSVDRSDVISNVKGSTPGQ